MKLYNILENQLKKENNFVSDDGELKKWVVLAKAQSFDERLIELLLEKEELKEKFFVKVKEALVFNQNLFIQFLEQKNYLNDSYTQYKNKVGLTIDGKYLKQRNEVALVWPFKDCILEGGQSKEEDKKEEIFFNEILAQDEITQLLEPKVLTNAKTYDKNGEHDFNGFTRDAELNQKRGLPENTITDNLIIKGNNLLALHTLKKEFAGKVKLIYIDPPYNTEGAANTFSYNNSFNHSSWLTFVKNRAEISKQILKNDGFFALSIDNVELLYVGVLLDDIFGRENRIGIIAIETNPRGRADSAFFATSHEYLLVYALKKENVKINDLPLNSEQIKNFNLKDGISEYRLLPFKRSGSNSRPEERPNLFYPIYYNEKTNEISTKQKDEFNAIYPLDTENNKRVWRQSSSKCEQAINNGDLVVKKQKNGDFSILLKDRIKEGRKAKTFWSNPKYDASSHGTILLKKFFNENVFSYPKSIYLMKDIIKILTNKNDLILDYHAGSGTTAHAVLELNKEDGGNRQFILCEQMDYIETVTVPRVQKVIENDNSAFSFTYLELKKYNQTFMEQIEEAKDSETLLNIWEQMKEKSFLNYNVDLKKQDAHIDEFKQLELAQQKEHLAQLLDKNQLYVNLSSMDDTDFECNDKEKQVSKDFYQLKKD